MARKSFRFIKRTNKTWKYPHSWDHNEEENDEIHMHHTVNKNKNVISLSNEKIDRSDRNACFHSETNQEKEFKVLLNERIEHFEEGDNLTFLLVEIPEGKHDTDLDNSTP
jgi:hypothetical protein